MRPVVPTKLLSKLATRKTSACSSEKREELTDDEQARNERSESGQDRGEKRVECEQKRKKQAVEDRERRDEDFNSSNY